MLRVITIIVLGVVILAGVAVLGFYAYYGIAANTPRQASGRKLPFWRLTAFNIEI